MKKIITFLFLLMSVCTFAQEGVPVTKFLGIPVDGFKPQMIQKLKDKGFVWSNIKNCLTGEFNGRDVDVFVATNNNRVWRIMLSDQTPSSATDIRIRFNTLCSQFGKNRKKYMQANMGLEDYEIPEDEDIRYNMSIKDKRYEAAYWQITQPLDSNTFKEEVAKFKDKYADVNTDSLTDSERDSLGTEVIVDLAQMIADKYSKNSVWFMISKDDGPYSDYERPYRIVMYYDNENNHSNGEDL